MQEGGSPLSDCYKAARCLVCLALAGLLALPAAWPAPPAHAQALEESEEFGEEIFLEEDVGFGTELEGAPDLATQEELDALTANAYAMDPAEMITPWGIPFGCDPEAFCQAAEAATGAAFTLSPDKSRVAGLYQAQPSGPLTYMGYPVERVEVRFDLEAYAALFLTLTVFQPHQGPLAELLLQQQTLLQAFAKEAGLPSADLDASETAPLEGRAYFGPFGFVLPLGEDYALPGEDLTWALAEHRAMSVTAFSGNLRLDTVLLLLPGDTPTGQAEVCLSAYGDGLALREVLVPKPLQTYRQEMEQEAATPQEAAAPGN